MRAPARKPILATAFCACAAMLAGAAEPRLVPVEFDRDRDVRTVIALHRDRAGFLWIGTRLGLILYDGRDSILYEHDISDPDSLSDNTIRTVYEDRSGRIWLGTNAGGLELFDHETGGFVHHRHDSSDPSTLSHDSVNVILEDREGALWVGTQIGLNRRTAGASAFERIPTRPEDPTAIGHPYVYDLHEDGEGGLWIATVGGGVYRRDPDTGTFDTFRHDPDGPAAARRDFVFGIAEDERGDLWVATERGVSRVDRERRRLVPVALDETLCTMIEAGEGHVLWVGTWGEGLLALHSASGRRLELGTPPDFSDQRIAALDLSRDGTLWVGTWDRGLHRTSSADDGPSMLPFDTSTDIRDTTMIHASDDGTLWIGTWGGGLMHWDRESGRVRPTAPGTIPGFDDGTVRAMTEDREGRYWLGTNAGLARWDPRSRTLVRWSHADESTHPIAEGFVTSLLEDRRGAVWIGVGGGGLHRWVGDDARLEHFRNDPTRSETLSEDYVTRIFESSDGTLWIGTRSGGLNAYDPKSGGFRRFLPDAADPASLSHHYVTGIGERPDGVLWIATGSGGLNRARKDASGRWRFEHFTEREGLSNNNVRSLAIDEGGDVWLSTNQGISRFDPERGVFFNSDAGRDRKADFNVGSVAVDADAIYFGGADGVVRLEQGREFEAPEASPTVIRSVRTLSKSVFHERPAWMLETLEVPYGELLAFDFAVLDFGDVSRHRFAYRLEDDRRGWIELGDRRSITMTDLEPGIHLLRVRGRNAQGVWSEAARPLTVVVEPPFWMTTGFRASVLVAVVLLAFAAHRYQTRSLARRNRELLRLKEERERALEEAGARRDELHLTYERLRRLNRRLEMAKEEERKHIARELHDEMGQALTAAKINLQLLAQNPRREGSAERFEEAIELMDGMIGHVRALSLDLRPPLLDQLGLGAALRGYLEAQAARTGLDIRLDTGAVPEALPAEVEIAVFRAVQEAVTNIVRHAGASTADVSVRRDNGDLVARVTDDGRGFDVDAAFERSVGGQHLGLLGIRERVEGLGGTVTVHSRSGHGANVNVSIPLDARA